MERKGKKKKKETKTFSAPLYFQPLMNNSPFTWHIPFIWGATIIENEPHDTRESVFYYHWTRHGDNKGSY